MQWCSCKGEQAGKRTREREGGLAQAGRRARKGRVINWERYSRVAVLEKQYRARYLGSAVARLGPKRAS